MADNTTAADLARVRKGRVLKEHEQERALTLLGRGCSHPEVLRKLKISNGTWTMTLELAPGFRDRVDEIKREKLKEIEVQAFKLALGGSKTVKLTYQAEIGKDGVPRRDETGKPIMHLTKREVSLAPPDWRAVEFLLKARMPETYSSKALAHDQRAESLEMIRALLEGKLREMDQTGQPFEVRVAGVPDAVAALPTGPKLSN